MVKEGYPARSLDGPLFILIMQEETEYRSNSELRISTIVDHPPVLEGHAAVFNSLSEEIFAEPGWREIIRPGAFAKAIRANDVQALVNHDPGQLIGRVSNGTLILEEDEIGLRARIYPPDTGPGRDAITLVRQKFLTKMSFGFILDEAGHRFDRANKLHEITEVKRLFDVSPVGEPAFRGTDISCRTFFNPKIAEIGQKQPENESTAMQIALKKAFQDKIAARQAWIDARTPIEDPLDIKTILKSSLRK